MSFHSLHHHQQQRIKIYEDVEDEFDEAQLQSADQYSSPAVNESLTSTNLAWQVWKTEPSPSILKRMRLKRRSQQKFIESLQEKLKHDRPPKTPKSTIKPALTKSSQKDKSKKPSHLKRLLSQSRAIAQELQTYRETQISLTPGLKEALSRAQATEVHSPTRFPQDENEEEANEAFHDDQFNQEDNNGVQKENVQKGLHATLPGSHDSTFELSTFSLHGDLVQRESTPKQMPQRGSKASIDCNQLMEGRSFSVLTPIQANMTSSFHDHSIDAPYFSNEGLYTKGRSLSVSDTNMHNVTSVSDASFGVLDPSLSVLSPTEKHMVTPLSTRRELSASGRQFQREHADLSFQEIPPLASPVPNGDELNALRSENEQLRAQLNEQIAVNKAITQEQEMLKRKYFNSIALAVKLNFETSGIPVFTNVSIEELYEEVIASAISSDVWPSWIGSQLIRPPHLQGSSLEEGSSKNDKTNHMHVFR